MGGQLCELKQRPLVSGLRKESSAPSALKGGIPLDSFSWGLQIRAGLLSLTEEQRALGIHKRNEAQRIVLETQTGSSSRFLTAHCLLSETRNRVYWGQGWSWETEGCFLFPLSQKLFCSPRVSNCHHSLFVLFCFLRAGCHSLA